ncbi:MAG: response regulator [Lautropia sp.]
MNPTSSTQHFPCTILVIDDHPMMRGALRSALEMMTEDVIVIVAGALEDAFRLLDRHRPPELVLLDLNLPDACGIATIGAFKRRAPGIKVIAVSGNYDPATVQSCQAAGAAGFIPKCYALDQVLAAIRRALAGMPAFPTDLLPAPGSVPDDHRRVLRDAAIGRLPPSVPGTTRPIRLPVREYSDGRHLGLTDRQRGVLKLMLLGLPNKAICRELALAEGTVKVHVSAVLRALGVTTRAQVVVAAMRSGIRVEELR